MSLFFVFGKTNYSRDGSLYLQDLLQLDRKFPDINRHFKQGGFVMYHTSKTGSGCGIDMGLEKIHNKPAKGPGGFVSETAKKEAIALWNILRYEKDQYRSFLLDLNNQSEYLNELNLHHEFNPATTVKGINRFDMLLEYIMMLGGPLETDELRNIATGAAIDEGVTHNLLGCIVTGDEKYNDYVDKRLDEKEVSIQDPVSRNTGYLQPKVAQDKKPAKRQMSRKGMGDIVRYIGFALQRGLKEDELLKWELADKAHYLEKKGKRGQELKKANKHELMNALVSNLPPQKRNVLDTEACTMVVIYFMGLLRKLPVKTMQLKTYEQLMNATWAWISSLLDNTTQRLDIVFDIYLPNSIKAYERARRGSEKIDIKINSVDQALPADMNLFWNSSENKSAIQLFFYSWMKENYRGKAVVFYGGVQQGKCMKVFERSECEEEELSCQKEEADGRLILHIAHGCENGIKAVLVYSPDSDVFVNLLYHFKESFNGLEYLYVKIGGNKRTKKTVPIHLLHSLVPDSLISVLPAVHALTGADTTSKIGAKTAVLKKSVDLEYIKSFGKAELSEDMIKSAEKFLLQLLGQSELNTFDELRVRQYFDSRKDLSLKTIVCCSMTLELHIKRAHLQANLWYNAADKASEFLNPLEHGYHTTDVGIIPQMVQKDTRPPDLREACSDGKCATKLCPCKTDYAGCLKFCKCRADPSVCRNPYTEHPSDDEDEASDNNDNDSSDSYDGY